jgi:hypothetical protein
MKNVLLFVLLPFVILLPLGCHPPGAADMGAGNGGGGPGGDVAQRSDLFVPQNGGYLFSTYDSAFWSPRGFTLWALPLAGQPSFLQRKVSLLKSSGNAYAGYGLVFCQYDTGDPAIGESMLVVMINAQRQYSVGEANGSVYTPYTASTWMPSSNLAMGYGMTNTVQVKRDEGGLFTLSLNGEVTMTFRDGRTPLHSGGGDGYLVVISPQDSFPATPVTVTFMDN